MSLIILGLIIILIYAALTKYSNLFKTISMIVIVLSMTLAFLFYGLSVLNKGDLIAILDTNMNMRLFIHVCVVWFGADIIVIIKIIRNYRRYLEVNS